MVDYDPVSVDFVFDPDYETRLVSVSNNFEYVGSLGAVSGALEYKNDAGVWVGLESVSIKLIRPDATEVESTTSVGGAFVFTSETAQRGTYTVSYLGGPA